MPECPDAGLLLPVFLIPFRMMSDFLSRYLDLAVPGAGRSPPAVCSAKLNINPLNKKILAQKNVLSPLFSMPPYGLFPFMAVIIKIFAIFALRSADLTRRFL